jgi:hypothetical protein
MGGDIDGITQPGVADRWTLLFRSAVRQDAGMNPQGTPCPACGRPLAEPGPAPCPSCGLPAAGQAAYVVGRIDATLTELARDRDALLATLRASAPGTATPYAARRPQAPAPTYQPPAPPPMPRPRAAPAPRRRLSPQEVLLGLGALLVVAAAITFVAVAWTRLGLAFQAGVMVTVTAVACTVSAWTARRGLRATEEALAAAGAALLVVDLGAAHALGLFRLEDVSLRIWSAISCTVVVIAGLLLGRLTRTTATWPLAALLAAQPLPFLLLPEQLLTGPAGVATALALAGADLVTAGRIRPGLVPVARVLAGLWALVGVLGGLSTAGGSDPGDSWTATAVLLVACAAALLLGRRTEPARRFARVLPGGAGAVAGVAVALSLRTVGEAGWWIAAGLGLALATAAVLIADRRGPAVALLTSGWALVAVHGALLAGEGREADLAFAFVGVTVPAVLAAARLPQFRSRATETAMSGPWFAVLLWWGDGVLSAPVAGLLLALLAAVAFAVAAARARQPEEWVLAAGGAVAGLSAGAITGTVGAWGQVAVQLAVAGVAAGCYAVVARRRAVAVAAVADLVVAVWIAVGGAGVETPEAYTVPAAFGRPCWWSATRPLCGWCSSSRRPAR